MAFNFYLTDATNSLKTSVSNGKSSIASAITDKGVSTASDADFSTMANNIRSISTGAEYEIINKGYTYTGSYITITIRSSLSRVTGYIGWHLYYRLYSSTNNGYAYLFCDNKCAMISGASDDSKYFNASDYGYDYENYSNHTISLGQTFIGKGGVMRIMVCFINDPSKPEI